MATAVHSREIVALRDGTAVVIRPIRGDDAPRLQALVRRFSAETAFFRFLELKRELSDAEAERLANVDYRDQMAFVAVVEADGDDRIVGVARYAPVQPVEPGVAEFAIAIEDAYQRRGLGRILFQRLVRYARAHGIHTFLGFVRQENVRMMRFLEFSGLAIEGIKFDRGVWEVRLKL